MAGPRVLIVDDDPVTRRFVRSLLSEQGYLVDVAEDGEQAIALATARRPDLIVSDLVMPYRDGFSVIATLRADARLAAIPVVILSMRDREEDIVRGLEDGADDYVVKPFNARELLVRIRKLLGRTARV